MIKRGRYIISEEIFEVGLSRAYVLKSLIQFGTSNIHSVNPECLIIGLIKGPLKSTVILHLRVLNLT